MSRHLDAMTLGDCILAKGPKGRFVYERNMKKHIGARLSKMLEHLLLYVPYMLCNSRGASAVPCPYPPAAAASQTP